LYFTFELHSKDLQTGNKASLVQQRLKMLHVSCPKMLIDPAGDEM